MAATEPMESSNTDSTFSGDEIQAFIKRNADIMRTSGYGDLANLLDAIDVKTSCEDLERLEQRLDAIEQMMIERLYSTSDEKLIEARRALDLEVKPYRGKMNSDQISTLEKQFLTRRLLEMSGLPRLSLFYF